MLLPLVTLIARVLMEKGQLIMQPIDIPLTAAKISVTTRLFLWGACFMNAFL